MNKAKPTLSLLQMNPLHDGDSIIENLSDMFFNLTGRRPSAAELEEASRQLSDKTESVGSSLAK